MTIFVNSTKGNWTLCKIYWTRSPKTLCLSLTFMMDSFVDALFDISEEQLSEFLLGMWNYRSKEKLWPERGVKAQIWEPSAWWLRDETCHFPKREEIWGLNLQKRQGASKKEKKSKDKWKQKSVEDQTHAHIFKLFLSFCSSFGMYTNNFYFSFKRRLFIVILFFCNVYP